jgi:hypothetical protein
MFDRAQQACRSRAPLHLRCAQARLAWHSHPLGQTLIVTAGYGPLAYKERIMQNVKSEEVINLSKEKWRWMSERKVDPLNALFHEEAVFVHMGATMSKQQELEVIRSGGIHYKDVDIQETSVRFIGATAILLNEIRLASLLAAMRSRIHLW